MHTLTLADGDDRLAVRADGRLLALACGGVALAGLEAASFWRLYYQRGEQTQLEVRGDGQAARLERTAAGLRLVYDGLQGEDGPLAVDLMIDISLHGGAARFRARLANRDAGAVIKELQLPLIGDRGLAQRPLITTRDGGERHPDYARYVTASSRFRQMPYGDADHQGVQVQLAYPSLNAACNCFVSAQADAGVYFACHDPSFPTTIHILRLDGAQRDRPEAGFGRHCRLAAGQAVELGEFVVAPYRGTWHVAADRYRAWAGTWWKPQPVPDWLCRSRGWQRLIFKHQNGEVLFRYDDMPRIQADGAAAGLDTLFMFGWWPGGMDRMYPHYGPDPALGGEAALRANLRRFQDEGGGHVICYFSGRLIDRAAPWYREHGAALTVKRASGVEVGDAYLFSNGCTYDRLHGSTELTPVCLGQTAWVELLHAQVERAADLGCHAVFFDQLGSLEHPCHDPAHGHPVPYFHQAEDKRAVLAALQEHAHRRGLALGIEIATDCTAQHADFVHGLYLQQDIAGEDYRGLGRRPATAGFVEWLRYTFPEMVLSDRDIRDDEDLLRRVNLMALRGLVSDVEIYRCRRTIAEFPRYQEHLGALNRLRVRLAPWLVEGTYRDTCGLEVDGDIEARLFRAADGSAAVVATQSHLAAATATIRVPGLACCGADGVGAWSADPATGGLRLERDALAVLRFA